MMVKNHSPNGKKAAINPETWLADHGDYLFRYAMVRLRNREIAEDVIQETLLAALKGRDQFEGRASERTWLVGILKHKIMDHFRKSSREVPRGSLTFSEDSSEDFFDVNGKWRVEPASWGSNPKDAFEKNEFWKTFEACMAALPGRLAEAFALREFEELKGDQICNLLEISATNLGVMLYRARMRLAQCLESNWFGKKANSGKKHDEE